MLETIERFSVMQKTMEKTEHNKFAFVKFEWRDTGNSHEY